MSQLIIGSTAPSFDLPGTDGMRHSLNDYRGKVKGLVVIFSCNHCPHVIAKEKRMIELGKEYKGKGIEFVLISANDVINYPADSFPNMKKRAAEKGYPFPYLYDESQDVARAYGGLVTPHAFLFDSGMNLVYSGAIDDNADNDSRPTVHYLKNAMELVLSGMPDKIEPKWTQPRGCSIKWK